jgi:hypothetical protein
MNLWINQQLDNELPRRVTRASVVVGAFLFFFISGLDKGSALSYGLGAALGIYSFEVFRMGVRVFMRTDEMKTQEPIPFWKKCVVGVLLVIKLPLWIVTIYTAIIATSMPVLVFAGGLITPQFVLVSKAISKSLFAGTPSEEADGSSTDFSFDNQNREASVS